MNHSIKHTINKLALAALVASTLSTAPFGHASAQTVINPKPESVWEWCYRRCVAIDQGINTCIAKCTLVVLDLDPSYIPDGSEFFLPPRRRVPATTVPAVPTPPSAPTPIPDDPCHTYGRVCEPE